VPNLEIPPKLIATRKRALDAVSTLSIPRQRNSAFTVVTNVRWNCLRHSIFRRFEGVQGRGPASRAQPVHVHRRPLTGSPARNTAVLRRRGLVEKNVEGGRIQLRTPNERGEFCSRSTTVQRPKVAERQRGRRFIRSTRIYLVFLEFKVVS